MKPAKPVEKAALLMHDHKIGCLPVVDDAGTLLKAKYGAGMSVLEDWRFSIDEGPGWGVFECPIGN